MRKTQVQTPSPATLHGKDKRSHIGAEAGAVLGALIGAITGLIAGPPGAVAGALIGAVAGSLAGLANERYGALQSNAAHHIEDIEAEADQEMALRQSMPPPPPPRPKASWMDRLEESLGGPEGKPLAPAPAGAGSPASSPDALKPSRPAR